MKCPRLLAALALAATLGISLDAAPVAENGYGVRRVAPPTYVDCTNGNDANAGTSAAPWKTIDHARLVARQRGYNDDLTQDRYVEITGACPQTTPLAFTNLDGGNDTWHVIYQGTGQSGSAKIHGAVKLDTTTCTVYSGAIMQCPVPAGVSLGTIWENGVRARVARTPNFALDAAHPAARNNYLITAGVNGSHTVLQYTPGDLSPGGWDLAKTQLVIWSGANSLGTVGSRAWFTDTLPLSAVDASAHTLTTSAGAIYEMFTGSVGTRYYVQGDISMIDQAGEFAQDVAGGVLYYQPRATPITSQTIMLPQLADVVTVIGADTAHPVKNLVFEDLEIAYTTFPHQWRVLDNSNQQHSVVYLQNTKNVTMLRDHVRFAGADAVGAFSANAGLRVDSTLVEHAGANGIHMNNYASVAPDIGDVLTGATVVNDEVGYSGEMTGDGAGLYLLSVSQSTFQYLSLHDGPRYMLDLVGYVNIDPTKSYATGNLISNISAILATEDTGDCGVFNTFETGLLGGAGATNTWTKLLANGSTATSSMTDFPGDAFFFDVNTYNSTLTNSGMLNYAPGTCYREYDGGGAHTITGVTCGTTGGWDVGTRTSFPTFAP